jgi:Mg-chelatase subunit ChlD
VFVVDASDSITEADLTQAKDMMHNYTAKLDAPIGDNRIGIILIQTTASVYLSLGDGLTTVDKDQTLERIKGIPYEPHHFTNTADALCKLSQQAWRHNDSSTLQVAIVLTDGRSNHDYSECEGDTETMANFIHEEHPHILVFAIGIGEESDINEAELAQIASRPHLITRLGKYEDLNLMEGSFRYEICYTCTSAYQ